MLWSLMRGKQEGAGFYEEALQSRCRAFNAAPTLFRSSESVLSKHRSSGFTGTQRLLLNDDSIS